MDTRVFSAYNLARGVPLNSKLTVADSGNQPLKLLDIVVSGMGMDAKAGLWLTPLHAIPAVPRVFPFDLIYLDKEYRVLETSEMGPAIEFPPFHAEVASALILPADTLHRTQTSQGDRLIVCLSSDLEALLAGFELSETVGSAGQMTESKATVHSAVAQHVQPAGVIELAPEKAYTSIRPDPATAGQLAASGPSLPVIETVPDRSINVGSAIIEHHIDPEDLFSNWVVSPPSPPIAPRNKRPTLPDEPIRSARQQQEQAEPAQPNEQEASPAATQRNVAALETTSSAKPKTRQRPAVSEKPAFSAGSKTGSPEIKATRPPSSVPGPPATTFTAVPYGMWQISMPTALAPNRSKPLDSPKTSTPSNEGNGTKPAASSSVPPNPKTSAGQSLPPVAAGIPKERPVPQATSPAPGTRNDSPVIGESAQAERIAPARTSSPVKAPRTEEHTPGDFVASLQEKLQRAKRTNTSPSLGDSASAASLQASPGAPAGSELLRPSSSNQSASDAPDQRTKVPSPPTAAAPAMQQSPPKLKASSAAPPPAAKPKAELPAIGFRAKFKQWLYPVAPPSDRRRAARRYVPGMVAHYFTGGAPTPYNIADISMNGMYLLTDDRWMPGTMIQMTLQKPCSQGERKQSINVLSRIIRRGSDGVAAEFVMSENLSHISHDIQPSQATDKFALARFL